VTHLVSNEGTNLFTRSITAPADDLFFGGVPELVVSPVNGNFYYAYYDQPATGTNRPNIYLRQLTNGVDCKGVSRSVTFQERGGQPERETATTGMANATCLIWRRRQLLGVRGLAAKAGAPSHIFIRTPQHKGHPHPVLSRSTREKFQRGLFHREISRQPS
jgi:hypothetical protein